MTEKEYYNKDTIDAKLDSIHDLVCSIERQTIKTNGRVTKLERYMLIVVCVVATLVAVNGSGTIKYLISIFL